MVGERIKKSVFTICEKEKVKHFHGSFEGVFLTAIL